jgi:hypothetical protein
MTGEPSLTRTFRTLSGEAVADAVRRRIAPLIAVVALLSLIAIENCTSCTFALDGEERRLPEAAGWTGLVLYTALGLWTMVLGGVLASDHLAAVLFDGSASLMLARPVGRGTFALARLAGVLAITWVTGAALLLTTGFLLHVRHGLALDAAGWGLIACFAGVFVVAALAMTASLFLPRTATVLLVFVAVGTLASVNALALSGISLDGVAWALDRAGPPLCSALAAALAAWIEPTPVRVDRLELALRLFFWVLGSATLLTLAFRRVELGR